jgi:hypothetical protein
VIGDRWGMRDDEIARHYPCDDCVPRPAAQAWRAVTVDTSPDRLWPWIAQIRLAPYSYDWIDNLGRQSPQEIRPAPEPAPGQRFSTAAGRPVGLILSVSTGEQLTGQIMGAVMSYVLVPFSDGMATRLLLKIVIPRRRWTGRLVVLGDLVMARRQLLNLKQLAERRPEGDGT